VRLRDDVITVDGERPEALDGAAAPGDERRHRPSKAPSPKWARRSFWAESPLTIVISASAHGPVASA